MYCRPFASPHCVLPLDIGIRGKGGIGHRGGSRLHVVVVQGGLLHHRLRVFTACAKCGKVQHDQQ